MNSTRLVVGTLFPAKRRLTFAADNDPQKNERLAHKVFLPLLLSWEICLVSLQHSGACVMAALQAYLGKSIETKQRLRCATQVVREAPREARRLPHGWIGWSIRWLHGHSLARRYIACPHYLTLAQSCFRQLGPDRHGYDTPTWTRILLKPARSGWRAWVHWWAFGRRKLARPPVLLKPTKRGPCGTPLRWAVNTESRSWTVSRN